MIGKKILFCLFVLISLETTAQGRYCTSYDDFLAGNWIELPVLTVSEKPVSKKSPDASDFVFITDDKTIDKKLKNEAFAIECNDSLYICLRRIKHNNAAFVNNYAHAYPLPDNKILFTTRQGTKTKNIAMVSYGGFPVGVPFNMKFGKKTTVCYIVENIDLGHIPARLLGDEQITKVLKGHDALIDEYFLEENKSKRETSEHIFPLLKKAGIIE